MDDRRQHAPAPDAGANPNERLFARIAILQTFVSVMALVVAVAALYAALVESNAVRKQLDATVWPHVLIGPSFTRGPDGMPQVSLVALNSGIGPARIRHFQVTVDGQPVRTWSQMFDALEMSLPEGYVQSQLTGRVLQSGERLEVLTVGGESAVALRGVAERVTWDLCYCSVFDECYTVHNRAMEPASVARCPMPGATSFVQ